MDEMTNRDELLSQLRLCAKTGCDYADAAIEALSPVPPAEEGEFTSCADMLDDWFNSCNIQGGVTMFTIEFQELIEEMRRIEQRNNPAPALPEDVQEKINWVKTQATGKPCA